MAAYRQVYDSRHLQADYQEPGSATEPYVRQSSIGYLYFFTSDYLRYLGKKPSLWSTCPPHLKMHNTNLWSTKHFYLTEGLHCTCIFRTCVFQYLRFQRLRGEVTIVTYKITPMCVHKNSEDIEVINFVISLHKRTWRFYQQKTGVRKMF